MDGETRTVPVFEGVEIDITKGAFLKDCSIHGSRCPHTYMSCWRGYWLEWAYGNTFNLAKKITIIAAAGNPSEFRKLAGTLLHPIAWDRGSLRVRSRLAAAWLRRTLGLTPDGVLDAFERIARYRHAPDGYDISLYSGVNSPSDPISSAQL